MNSIPSISERLITLPMDHFSTHLASLGHTHSAFFPTTRLFCHHIAVQCHLKVILHQAQGYFRNLSHWIQQAFRAGIRPTLPKSGLQSCRTGASDALSFLSSITPPTSPPPTPNQWLPKPLCLALRYHHLCFSSCLQSVWVYLLMYILFFCLSWSLAEAFISICSY